MEALPWRSNGALRVPIVPAASRVRHRHFVTFRAASAFESTVASEHQNFIKNVAGLEPPPRLQLLLNVLQAKGQKIVAPENRSGLHPLVIPLTQDETGIVTGVLRWPTPPQGMEMPIVRVEKYGMVLLGKNVEQYVARILVEEEIDGGDVCYNAATDDDREHMLYRKGDYGRSKLPNKEVYLISKIGMFPDVFEQLALNHLDKGDEVSAKVAAENYSDKNRFPGFGRPFAFAANLKSKLNNPGEAKDSARMALRSPWWTLGYEYEKIAELAGWGDEHVEYMRERVTEEGREEDINKGKEAAQVALDQAAFLLDLGTVDSNWDEIRGQLSAFYKAAGLDTIAKFVLL